MDLKLMELRGPRFVLIPAVLMIMAASITFAVPTCQEGNYYDSVAGLCTDCKLICDEARGTSHLCEMHSPPCQVSSNTRPVSTATISTDVNGPVSQDTILIFATVLSSAFILLLIIGFFIYIRCYQNRGVGIDQLADKEQGGVMSNLVEASTCSDESPATPPKEVKPQSPAEHWPEKDKLLISGQGT